MGSLGACAPPINTEAASLHLTHYCIVRRDLPPGLQDANLIHAAGESSPGNLPKGTYAVALTVAGAAELVDLGAALKTREIPHTVITETEGAYAGQAMAVGIAPCDRDLARRLLSHLPLLGKAPKEVTGRAA